MRKEISGVLLSHLRLSRTNARMEMLECNQLRLQASGKLPRKVCYLLTHLTVPICPRRLIFGNLCECAVEIVLAFLPELMMMFFWMYFICSFWWDFRFHSHSLLLPLLQQTSVSYKMMKEWIILTTSIRVMLTLFGCYTSSSIEVGSSSSRNPFGTSLMLEIEFPVLFILKIIYLERSLVGK